MKNRILTFIIGILTGAIIMTLVFMIFDKPNNNNIPPNMNGQMNQSNGNMQDPPEKPDGNMMMPPQ